MRVYVCCCTYAHPCLADDTSGTADAKPSMSLVDEHVTIPVCPVSHGPFTSSQVEPVKPDIDGLESLMMRVGGTLTSTTTSPSSESHSLFFCAAFNVSPHALCTPGFPSDPQSSIDLPLHRSSCFGMNLPQNPRQRLQRQQQARRALCPPHLQNRPQLQWERQPPPRS